MKYDKLKINPWVFILLLLLLPSTIFTIIELSSMDDQEQLIEGVYQNQLDAVLYSINQYADDHVNALITSLEKQYTGKDSAQNFLKQWLNNHPQCSELFLVDQAVVNSNFRLNKELAFDTSLVEEIQTIFLKELTPISRLFNYYAEGYQKIMTFDMEAGHNTLLVFVCNLNGTMHLGLMVTDARSFINDVLSPRMQRMAGDNFILTVRHISSDKMVYSTLLNTAPEQPMDEKAIWLLPDYSIGIQPKGATIKDIARERAYNNLFIVVMVDLLLLIAGWLFYRNIKRELSLAKIKSDFVSNVSHEIRTPLALISMYAETLLMKRVNDDDKRHKYYSIIYKETQRLSGIVNNILNFSRIESGKRTYHMTDVDVNDVVSGVLSNYNYRLEEKGFELLSELNDLPMIKGDEEAISEAVNNLLDNAAKYSDAIKRINVSTYEQNGHACISVQDAGIGIPDKEQKVIFDKFYRVTKGALALHAKGSGLGLSIVKHIMDAHRGTIQLQSEEHKGSTFTLIFPLD